MPHCNSARTTTLRSQSVLVSGLVSARQVALLVLVLVLLISNGGAG